MSSTIPAHVDLRESDTRQGRRLEYFTLGWNLTEAVVGIGVGLIAGSVALVGFGVDSANQPDSLPRTGNRFLIKSGLWGQLKLTGLNCNRLLHSLPTGRDGRRLITFFRNLGSGFAVVIENGHRSCQDSRQRRAQGSVRAHAQESSKRVPNSSRATPKRRWTPNCAERLRQQPIP